MALLHCTIIRNVQFFLKMPGIQSKLRNVLHGPKEIKLKKVVEGVIHCAMALQVAAMHYKK